MSSASGANSYIALIKAATGNPSAIPATPLLQKVNFKSSDLGRQLDTAISENLRGDRRTADSVVTGINIAGGYDFEMTYENSLLDDLMEAFLWGEWDVDEPAAGTDQLKDGSTYQPFFIERGHTDIVQYFQFMGMACNVWTMEFADQSLITGSYQFVGLDSALNQVITTGATYTEATSNPVFSAVTDVTSIKIDSVEQSGCLIKEWDIEVNNNVTAKTGVGTEGACSTNSHKLEITGSMTMYFEDETMYDAFIGGTTFAFEWTMTDSLGNAYRFVLPKVKLAGEEIPIDGPADVMENISYVALYDSTAECMMYVEKTDV